MDYFARINELQSQYEAISVNRKLLEDKIEQRQKFNAAFHQQKAEDLKHEVSSIEVKQIRARARNAAMREQLDNLIAADDSATRQLQIQTEKLQKSKVDFVKILNQKDPNWAENMEGFRKLEAKRLEQRVKTVEAEIKEREGNVREGQRVRDNMRKVEANLRDQRAKLSAVDKEHRSVERDNRSVAQQLEAQNKELNDRAEAPGDRSA